MLLLISTITLFKANVRVMTDKYSGTILQMQPRYSCPVTQLFKWQNIILILKNSHKIFSVNSLKMPKVNYLENPSNESRQTAKEVPVF